MTSPSALATVLGDAAVLNAARDLLDAETRAQRIRTSGEPWGADRGELHFAVLDGEHAAEALATAARAAAQQHVRKETQP